MCAVKKGRSSHNASGCCGNLNIVVSVIAIVVVAATLCLACQIPLPLSLENMQNPFILLGAWIGDIFAHLVVEVPKILQNRLERLGGPARARIYFKMKDILLLAEPSRPSKSFCRIAPSIDSRSPLDSHCSCAT
ncbi:hypothetical protein V8C42DRAFT_68500 [Trichoderma barbatum]